MDLFKLIREKYEKLFIKDERIRVKSFDYEEEPFNYHLYHLQDKQEFM